MPNYVDICKTAHQHFNGRDLDRILEVAAETITYHDRALDITFNGKAGYRDFVQQWITAFPDARISDPVYIDGGSCVVAQFVGVGTNTGSYGPLPASGKPVQFGYCEIAHFNGDGLIAHVDAYYDRLSILTQLGFIRA
jgi:steroid delta-isomerase-like uncharacterized protein